MALVDTTWYTSSVKYAAITARPQNAAVAAGVLARQFTAPAVNNERVFVAIVAGTTANVTDATWVLTRGAKTTDGTVTWMECTGQPAVNGDLASTATWAQVKAATPAVLGQIIKRSNNASYQICTTAGAMSASEPAFSDTAGVTTTDTTAVWTSLGVVGNFPALGAPHARLANAYAANWGAAGNKFLVADNHAETQTATGNLVNPATSALPCYTVGFDHTASLPPVAGMTGASISVTSADFIIQGGGTYFYQGISFVASGQLLFTNNNGVNLMSFKDCKFKASNSVYPFVVGSTNTQASILWDNCTVEFTTTGQIFRFQWVNFEWKNTPNALAGAIFPTTLFNTSTSACYVICRGVDFSAFAGQLLANGQAWTFPFVFEDCKFNAAMTRYGASVASSYASSSLTTVRCDS